MNTMKMGLNLNYRFIKDFVVSPKIGLRGGFFPHSDLRNKNIFVATLEPKIQDYSEYSSGTFKSWNGYAALDILLSIQLDYLCLDIGTELNYKNL